MNLLRRDPTLNALNTTAFRIVVTMRLVVATITVSLGGFTYELLKDHHALAIDILDSTYLALVAFAGINAAQYAAKRFSDSGYAERKAAARVPDVVTTEHTAAKPRTTVKAKNPSDVTVTTEETSEGEE